MLRYHVEKHSCARASQRAHGCAHFQGRLEATRTRWEDDQVRMTSLETSEDTRAMKTGMHLEVDMLTPPLGPSPLAEGLAQNSYAQLQSATTRHPLRCRPNT